MSKFEEAHAARVGRIEEALTAANELIAINHCEGPGGALDYAQQAVNMAGEYLNDALKMARVLREKGANADVFDGFAETFNGLRDLALSAYSEAVQ